MNILTQGFVFDAIEASKAGVRFPIDFDDVWEALGYSRRDNAGRRLIADLIEGHDYLLLKNEESDNRKGLSPQERATQKILVKFKLTVEAFKMFAMAARTQQGREVRKYFIEIEQAYIQNLERQFQLPALEPQQQPIAPSVELPANLAGKTQSEIIQLASDYLQIRETAAKQMPTLLTILDHLANPSLQQEVTQWFTAKSWLSRNGYSLKMTQRQKRHFYRAIADCHRFLTIAQPQKHDGVNFYNNLHHTLLLACADNTVKLVRPTIPFI